MRRVPTTRGRGASNRVVEEIVADRKCDCLCGLRISAQGIMRHRESRLSLSWPSLGFSLELQAEVRKYLRQNRVKQLELEKLFAVVQDAEVGLTGKGSKKGFAGQDGIEEKPSAKKFGAAGANAVMLDSTNKATARVKKGSRQSDKRSDGHDRGFNSSRGSTNTSWKSGGTLRADFSRNDQGSWGRSQKFCIDRDRR